MGGTIRSKTAFAGAKRVATTTGGLAAGITENGGGLAIGATLGYVTCEVAAREALTGSGE